MRVQRVPCDDIRPDPRQRRLCAARGRGRWPTTFAAHGVLRPLLLRETAVGYVIVHGERRWQAATMAGLEAVPALVVQDLMHRDAVAA
jgi:ParB family chromosome partitioning protein